jgi:hypothetical protein
MDNGQQKQKRKQEQEQEQRQGQSLATQRNETSDTKRCNSCCASAAIRPLFFLNGLRVVPDAHFCRPCIQRISTLENLYWSNPEDFWNEYWRDDY